MGSAIFTRASVRKFTDEPVGEAETREILRAAMAAPSAGNQQPWEFWLVSDEQKRSELAAASPYAKPCLVAPLVIAFCLRRDVRWASMVAQDMAACVENALLRASELGLGAVWMGIYPEQDRMDAVRAVLRIPEGLEPFALVAVGHPAGPVTAQGASRFDESRIHSE